MENTLPQVPIPAGIPLKHFADQQMNQFLQSLPGKPEMITVNVDPAPRNSLPPIPCSYLMGPNPLQGTSIDPSLLKTLEKAVNTAKPMGAK